MPPPISKIRKQLSPNYGFTLLNNVFAVRIPRTSIYQLSLLDVAQISKIKPAKEFEAVYIIADKSHLKLPKGKFDSLVASRVSIEEVLRTAKGWELEDRYAEVIFKLLDTCVEEGKLPVGPFRAGRRTEVITVGTGKYMRYRIPRESENVRDIAIVPTIHAAVLRERKLSKRGLAVKRQDFREKVRLSYVSSSIITVLDTSSSISSMRKLELVKAVARLILTSAYQHRDQVALIKCSGTTPEIISPLTPAVESCEPYIKDLQISGATPLAASILAGLDIARSGKTAKSVPILVLITDGTANVPIEPGGNIYRELYSVARLARRSGVKILVVDISEEGSLVAKRIASISNGHYYHLKW
ncbi:MAG: VWA domain-containing protein [Candidatus Thermoplasmatota archaeon]|nr:VWA domain-containing protein [Candidatus Thermoplasmatota archaeon]MDI6855696.1 VWA domain-containing protein [Candidatus Thermoplasmatota archaeon]